MKRVLQAGLITSLGLIGTLCTALLYFQFWKHDRGKWCRCKNRVRGKTVVITGANSGIGYQVALDLAKKGARLYLGCRDVKKCQITVDLIKKKSANPHIYFQPLDLTDISSCKLFSAKLHQWEENLDILLNIAGVFHHPASLSTDGFDVTIQTNFLGVIALTDCLLGLLEVNRGSRIIFVSSESHRIISLEEFKNFDPRQIGPPRVEFWDHVHHYGLSKQALRLYASHLSVTRPTLKITSVNPGNVWTNIYRRSWKNWWEWPVRLQCALFMKSTVQGAQSIIHSANVTDYFSGGYISECVEVETSLSEEHLSVASGLIQRSRTHIPKTSF